MWFLCCRHNSKPHKLNCFLIEVSCHYLIFCFWSVSTSEQLGAPLTSGDLKHPHLPASAGWAAAELSYAALGLQKSTGTAHIWSSHNPTAFFFFLVSYLLFNYSGVVLEEQAPQHGSSFNYRQTNPEQTCAKTLLLRTSSANKHCIQAQLPRLLSCRQPHQDVMVLQQELVAGELPTRALAA